MKPSAHPDESRRAIPFGPGFSFLRAPWFCSTGLALAILAVYWPVTRCSFLNYDDPLYVTDNPDVRGGLSWSGLRWAFTTHVAQFWHPITWLSHMLDCQLYGLVPWGHHLTNLLLHLGNTLLLFAVLRRMTGAIGPSATVAALFGLHPLHVESVAWVAERKDVLSTCFGLLTLWAYARYVTSDRCRVTGAGGKSEILPRGGTKSERIPKPEARVTRSGGEGPAGANDRLRTEDHGPLTTDYGLRTTGYASRFTFHVSPFYLLALLFFALGLMSKPMLVTMPFVLLLVDYWPLRRLEIKNQKSKIKNRVPLLWEKLPFFALSAAASLAAFAAQKSGGSVLSLAQLPLWARVSNALVSYIRYLRKMIWPSDLAAYYPHPGSWPWWSVLGACLFLLGVTLLAVSQPRKPSGWLVVGWLWYLGTLVPVIGLVQVGTHALADRYSYLPSVGLFIIAAFGLNDLANRLRYSQLVNTALATVGLASCVVVTRLQLNHWQTSEALFRHAIAVTKRNHVAHNNLGAALAAQGKLDLALAQYAQALLYRPEFPEALNNLGRALLQQGRLAEAEAALRKLILIAPHYAEAYYSLGTMLQRQGQSEAAINAFGRALELDPRLAGAHNALGCLLVVEGKLDKAVAHFREALRCEPDDILALNNLGTTLTDQGRPTEAVPLLRQAIRLKPAYAEAHYNLANAWFALKRMPEAASEYESALRLDPKNALAHYKLGHVFYTSKQDDAAAQQYRLALAASPDHAESHYQLAVVLAAHEQAPEAIAHFRQAVRLKPDWVEPINNLAWLLATHPQTSNRDGAEALRLATHAVELTHTNDAAALDTLAAACAETRQFAQAVKTAEQAASLAANAQQHELARQIQARLQTYRQERPYRE